MTQQFIMQGRIVWGHPSKGRPKKDMRTKQPIIKDGQPVQQYVFGLAIEKNTFNQQVLPYLQQEVRTAFPNGVPSNFSWKYKDGDGVDSKGQPFNAREGYAGHAVMTISTEGFAPQVFKSENGAYVQILPEQVKCGDYVAVNVTIKYNGAVSPNTPGLYVNPNAVVHIGYGTEIVSSGQDPDELFAGMQVVLPPGASATPVMGTAPMPAGMHAAPVNPTTLPPAGMQYMTSSPAVAAPLPAPAHDFVNNAMGVPPTVPAPPMAPAPFPPVGWAAHPSASGYFYKDQQVLTEAQLRALPPALPGLPVGR